MRTRALAPVAIGALGLTLWTCSAGNDPSDTLSSGTANAGPGGTGAGGPGSGGASTGDPNGVGVGTGAGGGGPVQCEGQAQSHIWIANTGEGTLSKVCTVTGVEVGRYFTSPQQATGDPSRTSVNLHGDAVVTNRSPASGPSSVTKFAASIDDCIDRNNNGTIETSTGGDDVLPWGADECMLWNTPLGGGSAIGARATAWDGTENPETGAGGQVVIGALDNRTVYRLDGATGAILGEQVTENAHYGGVIDNAGNFWTVDFNCVISTCNIERIRVNNFNDRSRHQVPCGYGITSDAQGRIWTAGLIPIGGGGGGAFPPGCVARFDPSTNSAVHVETGSGDFNRGIAIGIEASAGYAWAVETGGRLIQVDTETMQMVRRDSIGGNNMVGVAIDFQGFVWAVAQGTNTAYKVDPSSFAVTSVPIGVEPYTYSDMTGVQLLGVIHPPN